ncbi:MAG TPA: oxidoreductase [Acidimicrobiia bacterium]|nr:oxidoreductase [Acidimicrobiia bacterium]
MTAWSAADVPDLAGRVAVVTGANRGLGREVTRYLAERGARVIMACRDEAAGEAGAADLRRSAERPGGATLAGPLEVRHLDLASLASVERFAAGLAGEARLDLLFDNAGVMAVDRGLTADGFETHIGVNHLGHFALTMRLLPALSSAGGGSRVVTTSSMGARLAHVDLGDLLWERRPYDRWQAYLQSKLANLLFSLELDRRLRAAGSPTAALAAHPGGARTSLGRQGRGLTNRLAPLWTPLLQPASVGALALLRAGTDPAARGGGYYGPRFQVWGHPVRETPGRRARDPDVAARLWEESERLTGVGWPDR